MKSYGKSRRIKKDKWANRMAIMGITLVVMCLAVAINIKGADLKQSDLDYQIRKRIWQGRWQRRRSGPASCRNTRFTSRPSSMPRKWPRKGWDW